MDHTEYGEREIALRGEILRTVVGSGVHGIAIEGTDDHDEMGVFVEPPDRLLGVGPAAEHYVYRTQPEGARSGPGDTDLVVYSLRKYLRLAIKGNPTALLPLYAPPDATLIRTELGDELRALAPALLSREAVRRFLGYLGAQRERLMGRGRQGRLPNRPELVDRFGYDTKYASHALRLAYQGREVLRHGRLTLPMPADERAHVLRVKRGDAGPLDGVLRDIAALEAETVAALDAGDTPLPERPDLATVSAWSVAAHRRHWGWKD
jgi:hypothetical protein